MTEEQAERKWLGGNNARHANFAVIGKRERKREAAEVKANAKWKGYSSR